MKVSIDISVWLSEEGIHIYVEDQEEIQSFFKLANAYIEAQCVPSDPPSIRYDGREQIHILALRLEALANYLRKQANAIKDWESAEDYLGFGDGLS